MLSLKSAGDGTGFVMEALGQFSAWIYQERHRMCICMCMKGGGVYVTYFLKLLLLIFVLCIVIHPLTKTLFYVKKFVHSVILVK